MALSNARLGFKNLLEGGSVVASSENAGFPVANVFDWRPSDFFKPASIAAPVTITLTLAGAQSADYFAFYNHDLHLTGGTIKLQYYSGGTWQDCFPAITPSNNSPRFVTFTSKTATQWRVVLTATSIFSIACISFGEQLALERGMYLNWTPPVLGRDTRVITSESDSGNFLGRSVVSTGIRSALVLQWARDAWVRASWMPFVLHAEQKPFFFIPNIVEYPDEAVFCWVDGPVPPPMHTHFGFMGANLPIKGMIE